MGVRDINPVTFRLVVSGENVILSDLRGQLYLDMGLLGGNLYYGWISSDNLAYIGFKWDKWR